MTDMKTTVTVNLPESLLLLAIDDETGKISSQMQAADLGTAAAVLLELLIAGRIDTVDGKIRVIDDRTTGDVMFDQALSATVIPKNRTMPNTGCRTSPRPG